MLLLIVGQPTDGVGQVVSEGRENGQNISGSRNTDYLRDGMSHRSRKVQDAPGLVQPTADASGVESARNRNTGIYYSGQDPAPCTTHATGAKWCFVRESIIRGYIGRERRHQRRYLREFLPNEPGNSMDQCLDE